MIQESCFVKCLPVPMYYTSYLVKPTYFYLSCNEIVQLLQVAGLFAPSAIFILLYA